MSPQLQRVAGRVEPPGRSETASVPCASVRGAGLLRVARVGPRTVVEHRRANTPLGLLHPRNHGTAAWVYQTTHGGGLVRGDSLRLDVEVDDQAELLLTTQASTKVYPSRGATSSSVLRVRARADATVVLLPDPVVCYADARYDQQTDVELGPGSTLVSVDILSAGRQARSERWDFERCRLRWRLTHKTGSEAKVLVDEAMLLDGAHGPLRERMGGVGAVGTVILSGPRVAEAAGELASLVSAYPVRRSDTVQVGASVFGAASGAGSGLVLRVFGPAVEEVTARTRQWLGFVPALLGDDPFASKR